MFTRYPQKIVNQILMVLWSLSLLRLTLLVSLGPLMAPLTRDRAWLRRNCGTER